MRGLLNSSQGISNFDTKVVDGSVNLLGKLFVILSFLIAWFDRVLLDGVVRFAGHISSSLGFMAKGIQGGKVQTYFIWALVGLISIFVFILF